VNNSVFTYGDVLNKLLTFILVAAVLFFVVIKPMNSLVARSRTGPTPDPTTSKCPECLSEIPLQARRCAFCTSEVRLAV
jgi:large conductance mechanosensitive channel